MKSRPKPSGNSPVGSCLCHPSISLSLSLSRVNLSNKTKRLGAHHEDCRRTIQRDSVFAGGTIGAACSLKIVRTNYGEGGRWDAVERNPESGASSANEPEKMRETREGMTVYKTDRAG